MLVSLRILAFELPPFVTDGLVASNQPSPCFSQQPSTRGVPKPLALSARSLISSFRLPEQKGAELLVLQSRLLRCQLDDSGPVARRCTRHLAQQLPPASTLGTEKLAGGTAGC